VLEFFASGHVRMRHQAAASADDGLERLTESVALREQLEVTLAAQIASFLAVHTRFQLLRNSGPGRR
jgi:hypothetical protein